MEARVRDNGLTSTPSIFTLKAVTGAVAVAVVWSKVMMIERPLLATAGGVALLTAGAAAFAGAGLIL